MTKVTCSAPNIMNNLLKSDFYRLFKSRSFYICTLIASLLYGLSAFIIKWTYDTMIKLEGFGEAADYPFKSGLSYALSSFSSGDIFLFMAIIIAVYTASDYTHGTMKNVVSKGFSKINIYMSKLITMSAACLIVILAMFIVGLISGAIVTGKLTDTNPVYGTALQTLRMIGIEILLSIAVVALFIMISMLVRNTGVAIAINIVGVIYFGRLIFQILDMIFKVKESLTRFSLMEVSSSFYNKLVDSSDDLIRAVLVGLAYLAVSTVAGIFAFKRMDVK